MENDPVLLQMITFIASGANYLTCYYDNNTMINFKWIEERVVFNEDSDGLKLPGVLQPARWAMIVMDGSAD